jgi:uncharacterized protein (DUF2252 family)
MMEAAMGQSTAPVNGHLYREVMAEFMADECPACRAPKKPRQWFCGACWLALPRPMAQSVWRSHGARLVTAQRAAKQWLRGRRRAA